MLCISVILPTYNPDPRILSSCLSGLSKQLLDLNLWELIIIDNNSDNFFTEKINVSWHPHVSIIREEQQGLTFARLCGFKAAKAPVIVMVDDDNVLNENYLSEAVKIMEENTGLGCAGGKSLPLFEREPPEWVSNFYGLLALRDLGPAPKIQAFENKYPGYAPIGAGMVIRASALKPYIAKVSEGKTVLSDRKGNSLSSSGDNDIVMEIIKAGADTGYFPRLSLQHIIPQVRTTRKYLARLNFSIQKSWVKFLLAHALSPWKRFSQISLPLRKLKAFFKYRAWKNDTAYVRWRGACGMFEGLAEP